MFFRNWKTELHTLPNLLSLIRILLIPVYVTLYLRADRSIHYLMSGLILAASCLTDFLDGQIARRFHLVTNLGMFLDPLADKATQLTVTYCLSLRHAAFQPVFWLLAAKECIQFSACALSFRRGYILSGAIPAGKICSFILFLGEILLISLPDLPQNTVTVLAAADIAALLTAFLSYLLAYCGRQPQKHCNE